MDIRIELDGKEESSVVAGVVALQIFEQLGYTFDFEENPPDLSYVLYKNVRQTEKGKN